MPGPTRWKRGSTPTDWDGVGALSSCDRYKASYRCTATVSPISKSVFAS
jgi:hypothetical protein